MIRLQNNSELKREHFTSPYSQFVMESVIEGNTRAEVYVDNIVNPQLSIVWDKEHSVNCGGSGSVEAMQCAVEFIKSQIMTEDIRKNSVVIKVSYENQLWRKVLLERLEDLKPNVYPRTVYRHNLNDITDVPCKDNNIIIKNIDKEITSSNLQNLEDMLSEINQMWGDIHRFIQSGFGYCAVKDDTILAWCTGEYFSRAWCGIGIETIEEYQGQGIATAATIEFLKHCKKINKTPHWDCWKNNIPSVKTAEKVGFEKLTEYEILFLRFV